MTTWICKNCENENSLDNDRCSHCGQPMSAVQLLSDCPTFSEYQIEAEKTRANYDDKGLRLVVAALGLAGEAGEFCDLVKKINGQGHELNRDKLLNELGDILWYVADAASCLGVELGEVAVGNINKLRKRYPNGFDSKISRSRYE